MSENSKLDASFQICHSMWESTISWVLRDSGFGWLFCPLLWSLAGHQISFGVFLLFLQIMTYQWKSHKLVIFGNHCHCVRQMKMLISFLCSFSLSCTKQADRPEQMADSSELMHRRDGLQSTKMQLRCVRGNAVVLTARHTVDGWMR